MEHVTLDCIVCGDGATVVGNKEDEYRRLARECLRLAHTMVTEEARRALVEMARVWTRLADDALLRAQPVQQQQQPQPKEGGDAQ